MKKLIYLLPLLIACTDPDCEPLNFTVGNWQGQGRDGSTVTIERTENGNVWTFDKQLADEIITLEIEFESSLIVNGWARLYDVPLEEARENPGEYIETIGEGVSKECDHIKMEFWGEIISIREL